MLMVDFADLRRREFARLDADALTYLDYTGAALPLASHIDRHRDALRAALFGNPHSAHAASVASTAAIDAARARVLSFFGVRPDTHAVIFTANTTAAVRLVAESFPFGPKRGLLLTADNHNSINGLREFARRRRASTPVIALDDRLCLRDAESAIDAHCRFGAGLFAFPAQSNFSGRCHPLRLVSYARDNGAVVLLDAAAYVATHRLDLSAVPADFAAVSFYKLIGFPTGVGALIARLDALEGLRRPWFAGGTVEWVSVVDGGHALRAGAEGFEDGTPNFLSIPAVTTGLDEVDALDPDVVGAHARAHARAFLARLQSIGHANGAPAVAVYGAPGAPDHGAVVTFNLMDDRGALIAFDQVERSLARRGIAVRGGCFCNPGAAESCLPRVATGLPAGALRASFGLANNGDDVERALDAVAAFLADYSPPPSSLSAAAFSRA